MIKEMGEKKPALPRVKRLSKNAIMAEKRSREIFEAVAKSMVKRRAKLNSLDEIASIMGSSKGIIYYYFKSKGDLFFKMQSYGLDLLESAIYPFLEDKTIPPRERLKKVIRAQAETSIKHWQMWRALYTDTALLEIPDDQFKIISRRRRKSLGMVGDLVAEVARDEGLECRSPEIATRFISGLVNSVPFWFRNGGELTAEVMSEYVVEVALNGMFEGKTAKVKSKRRI